MSESIEMVTKQVVLGKEFPIYGTIDEPLFMAKDVAEWIDYTKTGKGAYNVSKMLNSVDEDEKVVSQIVISGQNRECMCLTENGVRDMIVKED